MTQPSILKGLPAPLAEAIRELHWPDPKYAVKVGRIFESVAFPTDVHGVRAETLTAEQRAVAIALTELDLPGPLGGAFPDHRAVRRRWLGLDPAGPLEQLTTFTIGDVTYVEPIWRMAKIIANLEMPHEDRWVLRQRFDAQFTLEERLRLWGEVNTMYPYIWDLPYTAFFNWSEDDGLVDQLRREGKAWATDYLDAVLAYANKASLLHNLFPAFISLVRAGAPLEDRWDPIFTLTAPDGYVRELLLALPEPRRLNAALPALKRMHPGSALRVVIEILPVLPAVALAEYALSCIPKTAIGSPRDHRLALRKAAGTHADILALLDAADAAAGPRLVLTPTRERSIASEGASAVFSELDKEQLLACGKRYLGGKGAPLEVLLAENPEGPDEERSLRGQLFYRAIADAKGKHVYDAWLYQTDSGTIFKAGTARVAAEVVQFSVTCKDDRLAEALKEALRAEPSAVVAAPKKKAPSKKAPSKKAAPLNAPSVRPMSALTVTLLLSASGDELALEGCLDVVEVGSNHGALLLQFADAAGGLAALDACTEDIRGTMTVMGPGRETEYNCEFVRRDGNRVTFQQVCLDD